MKTSLNSFFRTILETTLKVELPKSFIVAILAAFFFFALVFTDYWNIPDPRLIEGLFLSSTILLGAAWAFIAGTRKRLTIKLRDIPVFLLLLGGLFWLNFRPLTSDLPWRGDEDHHFRTTLSLLRKIADFPLSSALAIIVSLGLILFLAWRKPKLAVIVGAIFAVIILPSYPEESLFGQLRYPFVNYWMYALAMYPWTLILDGYNEIFFRIVPFLSAVALAWFYRRELALRTEPAGLLWGFSVALIPSIFYYSSILYLEMPAVFLMAVACLRAERLLTARFEELRTDAGWYALILIGFLKETTLPFLLCFSLARAIVTLVKSLKERPSGAATARILGEVAIHFVTLMPLAYYLLFRSTFAHTRSYGFTPSNLLDPSVYLVLGRSFLEQFGIFVLFFLAGVVLLLLRRKYPQVLFYGLVIGGYSLFYLLEHKEYIGYSRFNLFMLPAFLAGAAVFIKWLARWRKTALYAALIVAIVSSLLLTPINRDGTKKPYWGNYLFDTSEHYYPVEESMAYLKEYHSHESVLFAGMYYEYTFFFYTRKLHWPVEKSDILLSNEYVHDDQANLVEALQKAEKDGYDNVLFFVLGDEVPALPPDSSYRQETVLENMAHQVVIYTQVMQP